MEPYDPFAPGSLSATAPLKDPKGSARAKFNRREGHLIQSVQQLEMAMDHLAAQDGRLYKRRAFEQLRGAVEVFKATSGLDFSEQPLDPSMSAAIDQLLGLGPEELAEDLLQSTDGPVTSS